MGPPAFSVPTALEEPALGWDVDVLVVDSNRSSIRFEYVWRPAVAAIGIERENAVVAPDDDEISCNDRSAGHRARRDVPALLASSCLEGDDAGATGLRAEVASALVNSHGRRDVPRCPLRRERSGPQLVPVGGDSAWTLPRQSAT